MSWKTFLSIKVSVLSYFYSTSNIVEPVYLSYTSFLLPGKISLYLQAILPENKGLDSVKLLVYLLLWLSNIM